MLIRWSRLSASPLLPVRLVRDEAAYGIYTQRELDAPEMVKQPARPSGAQLECRRPPACNARATPSAAPFWTVHDVVQQPANRSRSRLRSRNDRHAHAAGELRAGVRHVRAPGPVRLALRVRHRDEAGVAGPDAMGLVISFAIVGRGAASRIPIELARDLADRLTRVGLKALEMRHEAAARPSRLRSQTPSPARIDGARDRGVRVASS
jgi:hypothetical protein